MDQVDVTHQKHSESALSVCQKGEINTCSVGNTINIHVQHFNASQFSHNQYYNNNNMTHDLLNSLIPTFEKWSEKRFQIKIKSSRGIVNFDVHPEDTFQSIKLKLQLLYGIPHNKQYLVFGESVLEDEDTLEDRNLKNDSLLRMVYSFDENKTVLICQHILGRTFCLGVEPETTIKEVKAKIEEIEEIPADRQRLFVNDGRVLRNECKIADCKIYKKIIKVAVALVEEDVITVIVKRLDGSKTVVTIGRYETIEDLKNKIQDKMRVSSDMQQVIFGGQLLEEELTLSHYFIEENSLIFLLLRLSGGFSISVMIYIRTSIGEIISLGYCTLDTLISKIKLQVESKRGFLVKHQRLFYNDVELIDETKSIGYYGIRYPEDFISATIDVILNSKCSTQ